MEFNHRYVGQSNVQHGATASQVSFAPDTLREPTYFTGEINNHVPFREAISALHRIVVSDMRIKPKDRVAYFAWLETQKDAFLAEAATRGKSAKERSDILRAELGRLGKEAHAIMQPFYAAREKYFRWLLLFDRDAWMVLDPVITVHPDEIAFECFSLDESSYGRLACDLEMFDATQQVKWGVTNIDYSWTLYDAFQQIRSYRKTELRIEPAGFTAATDSAEVHQAKIDLPESWVRGFLQVSSAMTQPLHTVRLDPLDVHNICFMLRAKRGADRAALDPCLAQARQARGTGLRAVEYPLDVPPFRLRGHAGNRDPHLGPAPAADPGAADPDRARLHLAADGLWPAELLDRRSRPDALHARLVWMERERLVEHGPLRSAVAARRCFGRDGSLGARQARRGLGGRCGCRAPRLQASTGRRRCRP